MTARIYWAAFALLAVFGAAESLKGRGMPTEVANLKRQLDELPKELGGWTGVERALDPEIFKAIGAKDAINRTYRDKRGDSIALHSAVFLQYGAQGLPHSPEICYPAAGFHINESNVVDLDSGDKSAHPARLDSFERDGQQTYCLYWYQFGNATFCDGYAQRRLILGFRGQTTWPPMIKVMLETTGASAAEAEQKMKELAAPIFAWTKDFH